MEGAGQAMRIGGAAGVAPVDTSSGGMIGVDPLADGPDGSARASGARADSPAQLVIDSNLMRVESLSLAKPEAALFSRCASALFSGRPRLFMRCRRTMVYATAGKCPRGSPPGVFYPCASPSRMKRSSG